MPCFSDSLVKCVPLTGFENTYKHTIWYHFFFNVPVTFDNHCMITIVTVLEKDNANSKYTLISLFLSRLQFTNTSYSTNTETLINGRMISSRINSLPAKVWAGFRLMIDNDCIGDCKSNYHTMLIDWLIDWLITVRSAFKLYCIFDIFLTETQ